MPQLDFLHYHHVFSSFCVFFLVFYIVNHTLFLKPFLYKRFISRFSTVGCFLTYLFSTKHKRGTLLFWQKKSRKSL